MGTSKNPTRHAELVSESPLYQGIADHVRNDDCAKSVVFRSPHMFIENTNHRLWYDPEGWGVKNVLFLKNRFVRSIDDLEGVTYL